MSKIATYQEKGAPSDTSKGIIRVKYLKVSNKKRALDTSNILKQNQNLNQQQEADMFSQMKETKLYEPELVKHIKQYNYLQDQVRLHK